VKGYGGAEAKALVEPGCEAAQHLFHFKAGILDRDCSRLQYCQGNRLLTFILMETNRFGLFWLFYEVVNGINDLLDLFLMN